MCSPIQAIIQMQFIQLHNFSHDRIYNMNMKHIYGTWKAFVARMNASGIPMPLIRDPKERMGSVSLTLLFLASLWVQVGLLGKFSHIFGDVNLDQAMQFFYATSALYFGRKFSSKDKSSIDDSINLKEDP